MKVEDQKTITKYLEEYLHLDAFQNKTIAEVQEIFQDDFPHLKIRFYVEEYDPKKMAFRKQNMNSAIKLERVKISKDLVEINIDGHQTVKALELQFKKLYGLDIQIMRRSGNLWVAINATNNLTLNEQNEKGFSSTKRIFSY